MPSLESVQSKLDGIPRPLLWITGTGVGVRLLFWVIYPEIWKLTAVFNVFEQGLIPYTADFTSYKPSRMPFFDAFSAVFYPFLSPLVGVKSLVVFNLVVAFVAIPAFYFAVSKLFSERIAIPATILFALYPKYIVLTSSGLPEAASISFLALMLYAYARGRETGETKQYLLAGTFAMLSFAMFVPAVAAGVLLAVFVYLTDTLDRLGEAEPVRALVPTRKQLAFSAVPGAFGIAYLTIGPVSYLLADVSADRRNIFLDPEAYGFVEKLVRYHAYTFFDFWWHTRGFDRERGILPLLRSLSGFFGDLFPVYIGGWTAITVGLSVAVCIGIVVAARRRRPMDTLLLSWLAVYFLSYTYKNLGFVGGLQTRHVSAVFPAVCIAFGVGFVRVASALRSRSFDARLPARASVVLSLLVVASLSVLVVNGAVHGVIEDRKQTEAVVEPAQEVTEIVGDESVGVIYGRDFHTLVLYSENEVRPTILTGSPAERAELRERYRDTAEISVVRDRTLSTANVSYLYLQVEPEYLDRFPYTVAMNRSRLDALLATHETVYHRHIEDGPFRTTSIDIYLLRIGGGTED